MLAGASLVYAGFINWLRGQVYVYYEVMILCFAAYIIGFILLLFSIANYEEVTEYKSAIFFSLIFYLIFHVYVGIRVVSKVYGTDAIAFCHYAAQLFLTGQNPYSKSMLPALEKFGVPSQFLTPGLNGTYVSRLNYPALSFLIYVPFITAGISDMRWVELLFHFATVTVIYFKAPKNLRPIILLPLFIFSSLMDFTGGGLTDFLWTFPIVLTAIYIDNLRISAVLYGIACSIKQTPWVAAPFILILLWKERAKLNFKSRLREAAKFIAIAIGVFIVTNVYFIILNPNAWLQGVLTPISGGLIPFGQGLSTLSQSGAALLPQLFFTICTLLTMIFLMVAYYLKYDKMKYALWLFPAIILWFSYRGLQNYYVYWLPPLLVSFSQWFEEKVKSEG